MSSRLFLIVAVLIGVLTVAVSQYKPGNGGPSLTGAVATSPTITLRMDNYVTSVFRGQLLTYDIIVKNTSASGMDNVVVRGPFSPEFFFLGATQGGTNPNPNMARWDIGRLESGQQRRLQLMLVVRSTAVEKRAAGLSIQVQQGNDAAIVAARDQDVIGPSTDADVTVLTIGMTDGVTNIVRGSQVTYSVTLSNNARFPVNNVVVRGRVSPLLTFVSATNGGYMPNPGIARWDVGAMAAGEIRRFSYIANVNADATVGDSAASALLAQIGSEVVASTTDTDIVKAAPAQTVCGNNVCETGEDQLICPPCVPGGNCTCVQACPADCSTDNPNVSDEIDDLINDLSSPDVSTRSAAERELAAQYNDDIRTRLIARLRSGVDFPLGRMGIAKLLTPDINRTDVFNVFADTLETETDNANKVFFMQKINNCLSVNPELLPTGFFRAKTVANAVKASSTDPTVISVSNQLIRFIDSMLFTQGSGSTGGATGGTTGGASPVCGDGVCSTPRENGVSCARDCYPQRYAQCTATVIGALYPQACAECLQTQCTLDGANGRARCAEACVLSSDAQ